MSIDRLIHRIKCLFGYHTDFIIQTCLEDRYGPCFYRCVSCGRTKKIEFKYEE